MASRFFGLGVIHAMCHGKQLKVYPQQLYKNLSVDIRCDSDLPAVTINTDILLHGIIILS